MGCGRCPRWDLAHRLGRQGWLARRCGVVAGGTPAVADYVAFLGCTAWARWLCNRAWPARLCRWLGLCEDMHVVARRPAPQRERA
jgi:hypothetical protein